jgi:Holliday junction resolvasome RuvABC endonuclease subunit
MLASHAGAPSDFADALAIAVTIDAGVIDFGGVNFAGPIAF